jgi:hypothetical protein
MADTTYTWTISNMERDLATGMVTVVHYRIVATNQNYVSSTYGSVGLDAGNIDTMIPYVELDEFTVASWVADKLGPQKVDKVQQALQNKIDLQRTPVTGTGLPWAG